MLIACGADVYAESSEGILKVWEVAQRKDLTSSSQNRRIFMVWLERTNMTIFFISLFLLLIPSFHSNNLRNNVKSLNHVNLHSKLNFQLNKESLELDFQLIGKPPLNLLFLLLIQEDKLQF
jgi:hypothetical protein